MLRVSLPVRNAAGKLDLKIKDYPAVNAAFFLAITTVYTDYLKGNLMIMTPSRKKYLIKSIPVMTNT